MSKKSNVATEELHFTVQGEFVCKLVRDLFQKEGEEAKAFKILMEGIQGMDPKTALLICIGAKELRGYDNDMELVDLEPGEDFSEVLTHISGLRKTLRDTQHDLDEVIQDAVNGPEYTASPWGLIPVSRSFKRKLKEGTATWDDVDRYRLEPIDEVESLKAEGAIVAALPPGMDPKIARMVSAKAEALFSPAKDPEVDFDLEHLNGWLDPEGRLWPCAYACHVDLAADLKSSEKELEDKGWVKIQNSEESIVGSTEDIFVPDRSKPVTQSQYDTLWSWCKKHSRKFPEWVKVG